MRRRCRSEAEGAAESEAGLFLNVKHLQNGDYYAEGFIHGVLGVD